MDLKKGKQVGRGLGDGERRGRGARRGALRRADRERRAAAGLRPPALGAGLKLRRTPSSRGFCMNLLTFRELS